MDPREVEDAVARDVLGWTLIRDIDVDYTCMSGPGWHKQDDQGDWQFMGWPDQWASDMDAAWKLSAQLAKDGMVWQLNTMKDGVFGSFVELGYLPSSIHSYHETVEAEAGPDQMPLAMCLALLKMAETKKVKTADGIKTV